MVSITAVRSRGIPCVYEPLKEGYRSWGGGIGLSASLSGMELDAAYEYINWYLSGWVGGFLMRQGYYSAVPETSKAFMSENEWGYWFEGKQSTADITSPFGDKLAGAGEVRDGGSFYDRMGAVACWNSVMEENQYMVGGFGPHALFLFGRPMTKQMTAWIQAAPIALVLAAFLVAPIIMIVIVSFWGATEYSIYPAFEFDNYEFLFGSPVTYTVFFNTFKYAAITAP